MDLVSFRVWLRVAAAVVCLVALGDFSAMGQSLGYVAQGGLRPSLGPPRNTILPPLPGQTGQPGISSLPDTVYQPQGETTSLRVSDSQLKNFVPQIPNLQWAYLYFWGNRRRGFLTMDYAYPVAIGKDVVFGEFHGRFEDPLQLIRGSPLPNMQFLFGGGYRIRITKKSMVGILGFYNTTRYYGQWYSSGIVGLEACVFTPGDGCIDASLYHYGNVFRGDSGIFAAFRHGAGDFKFEGAYSQPLFERRCVLRAKASRYVFNKLGNVRGYYVGADLSSSDGMYRLEYLTGHDALSGTYHKLGFYFTVGFRTDKLFAGENPFSKP